MSHHPYPLRMNMFVLVITVALMMALSLPPSVHATSPADSSIFRISPVIMDLRLVPQTTSEQTIIIENLSALPLPVKVTVEDFSVVGESGAYSLTPQEETTSIRDWINLSETDLILEPNEKKELNVTIQTPKEIPFGGYYGILFVKPIPPKSDTSSSLLQTKVGALILANIGSRQFEVHPAQIESFVFPAIITKKAIPVEFRVKNTSLYHFSAKPTISVEGIWGSTYSNTLVEHYLFPGKTRKWSDKLTFDALSPGFHHASLKISVGNGEQISSQKTFLYLPVGIPIALILTIAGLALGVGYYRKIIKSKQKKKKKRKKKKSPWKKRVNKFLRIVISG